MLASANSRFDLVRVYPTGRVLRCLAVVSTCAEPVPYDLRLLPNSSAVVVGYYGRNAYLARVAGVALPLATRKAPVLASVTTLYPNPARGTMGLRHDGPVPAAPRLVVLVVVNALGQRRALALRRHPGAGHAGEYQAERGSVPAGVYGFQFWDADRLLASGGLALN